MLAADPDPLSERCRTSWPFRYGGEQRGPRSWRYNPRAARPKARYLMPRFIRIQSLAVLLALLLAVPTAQISARQEPAVVRAVFFYSPSCGHCQYVISEVFPLLFEQYGDQIEIIGIDVTNPAAQALFQAAIEFYEIPEEVRGSVPLLTLRARGHRETNACRRLRRHLDRYSPLPPHPGAAHYSEHVPR